MPSLTRVLCHPPIGSYAPDSSFTNYVDDDAASLGSQSICMRWFFIHSDGMSVDLRHSVIGNWPLPRFPVARAGRRPSFEAV